LGQLAADVRVIFITLDPERDTPARLKSYVSGFDPRFVGLRGTTAQVDQAAGSFKVQYARVPLADDYTIDHSTATFVLDGAGRLRLIGGAKASVTDFVHDISALVAEQVGRDDASKRRSTKKSGGREPEHSHPTTLSP